MPAVVSSQTTKKQLQLQLPPLLLLPLQPPKLKKTIMNMDSGNATGVARKMVVDVGVAGRNARTLQNQNVKMENKRLMMTAQSTTLAKTVLLSNNLVPGVSDTMPKIRNVPLCSS